MNNHITYIETYNNVMNWLTVKMLFCLDVCIWLKNISRNYFYDYLNLCGYDRELQCVYYTYEGERYAIHVPKSRGVRKRYPQLEEFYNHDPELMVALMGPFNDWHGQGELLMKYHDLE